MLVLSQNLEKRPLVKGILDKYAPDVALFQEWVDFQSPTPNYIAAANNSFMVSGNPCGTSVYSTSESWEADSIFKKSPHSDYRLAFWKGFVYKTSTAVKTNNRWLCSIHGYNGFPSKSISKLCDHVDLVAKSLPDFVPAVISGDFNTWTNEHLLAIQQVMRKYGFSLQISAAYDKKKTMDHVFSRSCAAVVKEIFHNDSDHPGILFEVK